MRLVVPEILILLMAAAVEVLFLITLRILNRAGRSLREYQDSLREFRANLEKVSTEIDAARQATQVAISQPDSMMRIQ